jgi:hypothetical protein
MMLAITAAAGDWVKAGSYQMPMPATAQGADGRLPQIADGTNERQLTCLGPRVDLACADGGTSRR